ncbi:hypothetical protein Tco_1383444 [Tanacetum coccineum]
MEELRESFNELMDTPLDFSAFVMTRLKVDTLTPELLVEVYKATTNQLDWNNPEGQQYPHDLRKPLPLIRNSRGRRVIPFDHFINNDLAYLSVEWHNYKHLDWITIRRDDDKLYKFKEGDFNRLRIQDIEDMLLLLVSKVTKRSSTSQSRILIDQILKEGKLTQHTPIPETIWRQSDKDKAGAMIQLIDKQLKTRRIMQSLEKFNIRVISFTMKMEILLNPTSNKLMVEHAEFDESDTHVLERFDTSAGNPVKEILL